MRQHTLNTSGHCKLVEGLVWSTGSQVIKGEAYRVPGGQGVGLQGLRGSRGRPTGSEGSKGRPPGSEGVKG